MSKPTRPLDYAIIKFTSAAPALDYAMIKLWRLHTRQCHAPFLNEHSGVLRVTLRRKMAELWRFEDYFYYYIHTFLLN